MRNALRAVALSALLLGSAHAADRISLSKVAENTAPGLTQLSAATILEALSSETQTTRTRSTGVVAPGDYTAALKSNSETEPTLSFAGNIPALERSFADDAFPSSASVFGEQRSHATEDCTAVISAGPQFQSCASTVTTYNARELTQSIRTLVSLPITAPASRLVR